MIDYIFIFLARLMKERFFALNKLKVNTKIYTCPLAKGIGAITQKIN
ncbi:hypothetical protein D082_22140 [Synechocystis sp. PCC 6714]|nr:hypothetical protein D082_22140 [Synechocystis sp. PCC 6714]